jgi:hypothetical protein
MSCNYQICPNPVKNYFTIKPVNPDYDPITLSIFTKEGILYQDFEFKHSSEECDYLVDIRNLPPGEYYLLIHTDNGDDIETFKKNL